MANSHNLVALDWIKNEVDFTLNRAASAIESFSENDQDTAPLDDCSKVLRQIINTLQIVELKGAILLLEELEKVVANLKNQTLTPDTISQSIRLILKGLNAIPAYIDQVQKDKDEIPVLLLPIINDLKDILGSNQLTFTEFFDPNMDIITEQIDASKTLNNSDLGTPKSHQLLKKIRQLYQFALVSFSRGQDLEENMRFMIKALTRLERITEDTPLAYLWSAAIITIEGIKTGKITSNPSVNILLANIDRQIKHCVEHQNGNTLNPPADLLKNLLYYVYLIDSSSDRSKQLIENFHLKDALPEKEQLTLLSNKLDQPNKHTFNALVSAFTEDLDSTKDQLDLLFRKKNSNAAQIKFLTPKLQQISGTLSLLSLDDARQAMNEQIEIFQQLDTSQTPVKENQLMDLAITILFAESSVKNLTQPAFNEEKPNQKLENFNQAKRIAIRECRSDLDRFKETFVNFIQAQFNTRELLEAPSYLRTVEKNLNIIELGKVSKIVSSVCGYVQDSLIKKALKLNWEKIDTFADVITSIDYYLEQYEFNENPDQSILDVAIKGLAIIDKTMGDPLQTTEEPAIEESLEIPLVEILKETPAPENLNEKTSELTKPSEFESEPKSKILEVKISDAATDNSPTLKASPSDLSDEEALDPELKEIFIEEAEEILERLNTLYPELVQDHSNLELLNEIRRDFHTLKGSGRMVKADIIGEFCWQVERLLNHFLDANTAPHKDYLKLIEYSLSTLPGLIDSFSNSTPLDLNVGAIAEKVEQSIASPNQDLFTHLPNNAHNQTHTPDSAEHTTEMQELAHNTAHNTKEEVRNENEAPLDVNSDQTLLSIFIAEAKSHLSVFKAFLQAQHDSQNPMPFTRELLSALHTLKGSSNMADIVSISEMCNVFEPFIKLLHACNILFEKDLESIFTVFVDVSESTLNLIETGTDHDSEKITYFKNQLKPIQLKYEPIIQSDSSSQKQTPESLWFSKSLDAMEVAIEYGELALENEQPYDLEALTESLQTLSYNAISEELWTYAELCDRLHEAYTSWSERKHIPQNYRDSIYQAHQGFIALADALALGQTSPNLSPQIKELENAAKSLTLPEIEQQKAPKDKNSMGSDLVTSLSQQEKTELIDIFFEEASDIIQSIRNNLNKIKTSKNQKLNIAEFSRDFHMLKGGSDLAGMPVMSKVSDHLELLCESLLDNDTQIDEDILNIFETTQTHLENLLQALIGNKEYHLPSNIFEQIQSHYLRKSHKNKPSPEPEHIEQKHLYNFPPETTVSQTIIIFSEEASDILQGTRRNLNELQSGEHKKLNIAEFSRDFHTLKGGAALAGLPMMSKLSGHLELFCESLLDKDIHISKDIIDTLEASQTHLENLLEALIDNKDYNLPSDIFEQIQSHQLTISSNKRTTENTDKKHATAGARKTASTTKQKIKEKADIKIDTGDHCLIDIANWNIEVIIDPNTDIDLLEIFLEEGQEILEQFQSILDKFDTEHGLSNQNEVKRLLHTLKGGAKLSGFLQLGDYVHQTESLLETHPNALWDSSVINICYQVYDFLEKYLSTITQTLDGEAPNSIGAINSAENQTPSPIKTNAQEPKPEINISVKDLDPEILGIFLEEINELTDNIDKTLQQWAETPENVSQHKEELKRALHTLKGGARLSGLGALGDFSHDFESLLEEKRPEKAGESQHFLAAIHKKYDDLITLIESIKKAISTQEESPAQSLPDQQLGNSDKLSDEEVLPPQIFTRKKPKPQSSQEMIRVSSALLEKLVNSAGETSIARGRVEQEINDFGYHLEDMHMTVERMREKIRRIEAELETHTMARYDNELVLDFETQNEGIVQDEDFDPLEMDQYSLMHQLAKSLSESASDLADIKDTLSDRIRSTETLLMLQARINTELQEGLMRTRMVPFSRLSPKLKRVVRQVASELGKEVELNIINAEGEMDRNVLERMVAPLEHMLRNSVDHGIESPEKRKAAGKNPKGTITLELTREGNEIVLILSDDGGGINLERVKERAIKNKLMAAGAKLSDNEILQFISRPGFSTAASITQISGRGVGMDVVYSEIKQLGGNLKIHSSANEGSAFTVRLPFTVAVSRALMVQVADDYYAIPLSHIEGVVRINPFELQGYYEDPTSHFEYARKSYEIRYLGNFVHNRAAPNLEGQVKPLPVLLARNAERSIAIHVDTLIGSKEIVVKTVGPQLSTVSGLSGATILGDGNVVIILDLNALIRADIATRSTVIEDSNTNQGINTNFETNVPLIMVVDDSVTVRKVTSRLLERNGYEVMTAKDGVDAVTKLRDNIPDLMLLDIEMPRMDGFEVATHVRHDPSLRHLPIIMITSRTGDKHKERANAIGVNKFLGKPYQETRLLNEIQELVTVTRLNSL